MKAGELFQSTLKWLQNHYTDFRFFTERDLVWTVQLRILDEIERLGLPYRVFNDYTISKSKRADLAILNGDTIEVAVEFKYEPSHDRRADWGGDIWPTKFPVVDWKEVGRDVKRIHEYAGKQNVREAYSIFIDEGSHFQWRDPHPESVWIQWGPDVWMLQSYQRVV